MKYEFHVGDYVETVGGAKGYICDANKDWWYCTNADDEYSFGYVYRIVRLGRGEIHECYNRIGAYDFTKKEKKKIEQLEKDLPVEMKIGDKVATMKQYFDGNYNTIIYSTKMIDKINELVDAVNLLLDKSTES